MQRRSIDWDRVTRIRGVKLDKITYEENFLVIEMGDTLVSAGELDGDFSLVEREVLQQCPGISAQWMAPLEEAAGPSDMILWERSQSPGL